LAFKEWGRIGFAKSLNRIKFMALKFRAQSFSEPISGFFNQCKIPELEKSTSFCLDHIGSDECSRPGLVTNLFQRSTSLSG
jgi:hypothetical protein